ncbi:hypothetical protein [Modestobacter lapidis]|nr:hypothetical protein [Modestobacter lapidis]
MTAPATTPGRRSRWQIAGRLARRAVRMEIGGYQAIYRFLFRRPRVPAGAAGFSYHAPVLAVTIAFIVVSAVELVVVDLLVSRWPAVRIPLLVLGVWGLVWMFGLLFGMLTRPHAVGPDGIRVRSGTEVDIPLAWDEIATVTHRKRIAPDGEPQVAVDPAGHATLHMRMQEQTNIEVVLDRPAPVRLPTGTEVVHRIALYADDPQGFLAEVRRWATDDPGT